MDGGLDDYAGSNTPWARGPANLMFVMRMSTCLMTLIPYTPTSKANGNNGEKDNDLDSNGVQEHEAGE